MPYLFVIGNIRQYPFANAILAAEVQARSARTVGATAASGLDKIFVIHSSHSRSFLNSKQDWRDHLLHSGIDDSRLVEFTVDLEKGEEALRRMAEHLDVCLKSMDRREDVFVDLTNGSSLYKNTLAIIAYVLGARRQFVLLPGALSEKKDGGPEVSVLDRFWTEAEVREAYFELPDPTVLDLIAPTWLTEVRRFTHRATETADRLGQFMGDSFHPTIFRDQVEQAIKQWFEGESRRDGAALGSSVHAIGVAFEDLIRRIEALLCGVSAKADNISLAARIQRINREILFRVGDLEPNLIFQITDLLRTLRNASAHEATSPKFGSIRARLSVELLLATTDCLEILWSDKRLSNSGALTIGSEFQNEMTSVDTEGRPGETYYFGLDGDDTGRELETLFSGERADRIFSEFSKRVGLAMKCVKKEIDEKVPSGRVLFCSGDDILFKAPYDAEFIERLRRIYAEKTGGLTCSVGYGVTARAAYVALKLSKARPGKNSVIGVVIRKDEAES